MPRLNKFSTVLLGSFVFAFGSLQLSAQDHQAAPPDTAHQAAPESAAAGLTQEHAAPAQTAEPQVDIITPHITDAHHIELPWFLPPFAKELELPRWEPVHIGPLTVDFSPTKHVFFVFISAVIAATLMIVAARQYQRQVKEFGHPKGFAAAIEALVLYMRNEIILPNVGPHGEGFVPLLMSFFFFILIANLWGIVPWGSTATGNISVTAALAIISFFTIEIAGMRALGRGYIKTIVYWPDDMSVPMKSAMTIIMTPVELLGKFIKPVALALRLFANMTGGHIVLLALISLIFTFPLFAVLPIGFSIGILMLETLVIFLQAFVFTLLTAVFIGLVRAEHH
jgi:F-type H+-transporting ATPase subunit a